MPTRTSCTDVRSPLRVATKDPEPVCGTVVCPQGRPQCWRPGHAELFPLLPLAYPSTPSAPHACYQDKEVGDQYLAFDNLDSIPAPHGAQLLSSLLSSPLLSLFPSLHLPSPPFLFTLLPSVVPQWVGTSDHSGHSRYCCVLPSVSNPCNLVAGLGEGRRAGQKGGSFYTHCCSGLAQDNWAFVGT